ncbi:MAG: ABC transporter ATP-binding protein [Candidatus Riflebacteria bacterium]|nr:ABC transporter ATP-binding protein [Candidatus Riflebacteria bacterium]
MDAVLQLCDITKDYGRRQVLRGLSLTLPRGQILGYFGLNGAGKSTTNRILLGFARPTSGQGTLLGLPLGDPEARRHLGFLPENPYFYGYLTGREVLDYAARLSGVPAVERPDRVARGFARVRLHQQVTDQPVSTYSRGMIQRLGLAQALIHEPDFLLLDEPFTGLDPVGRSMLKDLLRNYREQGGTALFSSHQLLDAQEICDRVAVLHGGRLLVDAPLPDIIERHPGRTLEQIFLDLVGPDAVSGG